MVTPKFNVGDRVRCIDPDAVVNGLTEGKIYIVVYDRYSETEMIRIVDDRKEEARYFTHRFEPARDRPTTIRSAWNITEANKP